MNGFNDHADQEGHDNENEHEFVDILLTAIETINEAFDVIQHPIELFLREGADDKNTWVIGNRYGEVFGEREPQAQLQFDAVVEARGDEYYDDISPSWDEIIIELSNADAVNFTIIYIGTQPRYNLTDPEKGYDYDDSSENGVISRVYSLIPRAYVNDITSLLFMYVCENYDDNDQLPSLMAQRFKSKLGQDNGPNDGPGSSPQ